MQHLELMPELIYLLMVPMQMPWLATQHLELMPELMHLLMVPMQMPDLTVLHS